MSAPPYNRRRDRFFSVPLTIRVTVHLRADSATAAREFARTGVVDRTGRPNLSSNVTVRHISVGRPEETA